MHTSPLPLPFAMLIVFGSAKLTSELFMTFFLVGNGLNFSAAVFRSRSAAFAEATPASG